jgi:hypothetical protein
LDGPGHAPRKKLSIPAALTPYACARKSCGQAHTGLRKRSTQAALTSRACASPGPTQWTAHCARARQAEHFLALQGYILLVIKAHSGLANSLNVASPISMWHPPRCGILSLNVASPPMRQPQCLHLSTSNPAASPSVLSLSTKPIDLCVTAPNESYRVLARSGRPGGTSAANQGMHVLTCKLAESALAASSSCPSSPEIPCGIKCNTHRGRALVRAPRDSC